MSATLSSPGSNDPGRQATSTSRRASSAAAPAINGIGANRGAPADYDEWRDMGVEGWSWQEVLPFFKKLERDLDFDNEWHGNDGPLPIRRLGAAIWTPFTHAMMTNFVVGESRSATTRTARGPTASSRWR